MQEKTLLTAGGAEGFYLWQLPEPLDAPFDAEERVEVARFDFNALKKKNTILI